jgi:hypothetical protein
MTKTRSVLLGVVLLAIAFAVWILLRGPEQVDMSSYAPADSLLYLEANHPSEIIDALAATEAWKEFGSLVGPLMTAPPRPWLRALIARTGIAPIQSVILTRAQIAVVLTDLRTLEEGETLNVKPEGVLLIETHTSTFRVKPVFEEGLKTLAEKTYDRPTLQRTTLDGVEYLEWVSAENSRRIVGAITGSLIVVGTSEQAVRNCLDVVHGVRPSLKNDPDLQRMRSEVQRPGSLSFGYVPQSSSAKLLALGLPALMGRAPGDSQFQHLIANGAAKIFGSLAWSSQAYSTGIEDRYLVAFQPTVGARLKVPFQASQKDHQTAELIPNNCYSVTSYNLANPVAAWQALGLTVSSQVDTLSSVVFSALLKSSLSGYGLDDPEPFLALVGGNLLTIRLDENDERSILVAGVRDDAALRQILKKSFVLKSTGGADRVETYENDSGEVAARLTPGLVVIGNPDDVKRYAENPIGVDRNRSKQLTLYSSSNQAAVVTYTNDASRVRSFVAAVLRAKARETTPTEESERLVSSLPYAVTETTFTDRGLERITRSPLGQFSTLFPLVIPERAGGVSRPPTK